MRLLSSASALCAVVFISSLITTTSAAPSALSEAILKKQHKHKHTTTSSSTTKEVHTKHTQTTTTHTPKSHTTTKSHTKKLDTTESTSPKPPHTKHSHTTESTSTKTKHTHTTESTSTKTPHTKHSHTTESTSTKTKHPHTTESTSTKTPHTKHSHTTESTSTKTPHSKQSHTTKKSSTTASTIVQSHTTNHTHTKRQETTVYFQSTYPANAASMTAIAVPTMLTVSVLGPAVHSPANQFLAVPTQALPQLTKDENTTSTINANLASDFTMWNGSGTITYTAANAGYLRNLSTIPSYSRDSGRGGQVGNTHIFVFADTNTYTQPTVDHSGAFTGAVSNSVAMDRGLLAAHGKPPALMDGLGSFSSSNGALRGFVPWTEGEAAYNRENNGHARWAIWPAMSLIPLTPTVSLQYSSIVWINNTISSSATYAQAGVTLCEITVPSTGGGPVANRVAPRLFPVGDIQWGVLGGVRSYGASGIGGGFVYIFGKAGNTGLVLARAPAANVANLKYYQYWLPQSGWTYTMPSKTDAPNYTFYNGSFSAVDVFYSPRHLTYIMVYMNGYVDNTIYYRYLLATEPILPTYAGGKAADPASALTQYHWSGQHTLLVLPTPAVSYSYDGGAQLGYFGANDISRGGTKMLLSWTEPNGQAASGVNAGFWLNTAVATFA